MEQDKRAYIERHVQATLAEYWRRRDAKTPVVRPSAPLITTSDLVYAELDQDYVTVSALAERIGRTRSGINAVLIRMYDNGLVERKQLPGSRAVFGYRLAQNQ